MCDKTKMTYWVEILQGRVRTQRWCCPLMCAFDFDVRGIRSDMPLGVQNCGTKWPFVAGKRQRISKAM